MRRAGLCFAAALIVATFTYPIPAVQDEPAESQDSTPEAEEALPDEDPVATRITRETQRLAGLAGESGGELAGPLASIYDSSLDDAARLTAVEQVSGIVGQLPAGSVAEQSLVRQLQRRLEVAGAAVSSMQTHEADGATRELVNELLVRTAIDYPTGNRTAHSTLVRDAYRNLKTQSPAVFADIQLIFARHYFNHNLHIVVSEPMLARLLADSRTEEGGVADCILGAWVTGCQITDTTISADIKPSNEAATFHLHVNGRTRTNTQGRKKPATIYSRGNHHFTIVKPMSFDGEQLHAEAASMDVRINNRTVGVSTDYDGIPLIGGIARNIARREVARKKSQADAIAARKLANRALPQFEEEANQKFAEANDGLQNKLLEKLASRNIRPNAFSARSSETHLAVASRTIAADTLTAPRVPQTPTPARGLAVQVHESSVNAVIDSLEISGPMTPNQIIDRIEEAMEELLDRDMEIDRSEVDDSTVLDFSRFDPIRVRFAEGEIIVILRTGFIQESRDRTVPKHLLEIPLKIAAEEGGIVVTPPGTTTRDIVGLKPRPLTGRSSPRTVITARAVIKDFLENAFPEPVINVESSFNVDMNDGTELALAVKELEVSDGWLTLIME